jgi:exosome complex RNA-binding protein Csl4
VRKVAADRNVHGDLAVALRLLNVVCDERMQGRVAVALELALDQVGAAPAVGGVVGDAHHPVDALSVQDAFAGGDGVAGQLNALTDAIAVRTSSVTVGVVMSAASRWR